MAGNLLPTVNYVVGLVQTSVGHARIYNRHRSSRSPAKFEELFVESGGGLDYGNVRRQTSAEKHRGASHQSTRTHRIRVELTSAAHDENLPANAPEVIAQKRVEALVEVFRNDPSLGGNVERAQVVESGVTDAQVAAVACFKGYVILEAREALHW